MRLVTRPYMKINCSLFLLTPCAIFIFVAVCNLTLAANLIRPDQSPFAKIGQQAFDSLMEDLKNGKSSMKPDEIAKVLNGEHAIAEKRANVVDSVRKMLWYNSFAILLGVLLQLYLFWRLKPNTARQQ